MHGVGLFVGMMLAVLGNKAVYAQSYGHGNHSGNLLPTMERVLQPTQKQQIRSLMQANQDKLKNLYAQVQAARQKLSNDLLAGNDTARDLQQLETTQNQLLAERVSLTQKIVSNLSPTQRQQLAQYKTQSQSLHNQQGSYFGS